MTDGIVPPIVLLDRYAIRRVLTAKRDYGIDPESPAFETSKKSSC